MASDQQFTHTVSVPIGFADSNFNVPRPNGTLLYIKLRDDPATVNTLILAVYPTNNEAPAAPSELVAQLARRRPSFSSGRRRPPQRKTHCHSEPGPQRAPPLRVLGW